MIIESKKTYSNHEIWITFGNKQDNSIENFNRSIKLHFVQPKKMWTLAIATITTPTLCALLMIIASLFKYVTLRNFGKKFNF